MDRLLADVTGTVSLTVLSAAGVPVNMDAAPTVTVKDGAGTTLDTGTATATGTGVYEYEYTPTVLDQLTIVWAGDLSGNPTTFTTIVDVVGGYALTVGDVRGYDDDLTDLVKYPHNRIVDEIDAATSQLERAMRVAIVPRSRRVTLSGTGGTTLLLPNVEPRTLYSATVDGVVVDPADVTVLTHGAAHYGSGWSRGVGNVRLHYAHGWDVPPEPVRRAVKLLTVDRLVPSATPARATSVSTDVGAFRITVAGRDGYTGIPDVDSVIDQFGYGSAVGYA